MSLKSFQNEKSNSFATSILQPSISKFSIQCFVTSNAHFLASLFSKLTLGISGTPHQALKDGSTIGPSSSLISTGTFVSLKVLSK